MKNFYSKIKTLANTVVTAGALLLGYAQAQTTLAAGDIAFTAYDSNPSTNSGLDAFSFVLLTPISSATKISFTDQGYQGNGNWQLEGGTESTITWTSGTALPAGTEIYIVGLSASTYNPAAGTSTANGTVVLTAGTTTNGLNLQFSGDQVIAFQGGNGSIIGSGAYCIAGINFFYDPGSSSASWNTTTGPNASFLPPGLTAGTSALYAVTGTATPVSGKFNCTGVPASNAANIRTAVMNVANWTLSNGAGSQYSGCTFLASTPVITANPANRTICAGGTTTFTVNASGATSYQWYQNSGSGFIALTNTAPYSGVTTNTLTITGATSAMNGYQYRAVATGSGSATSTAATLTVTSISTTGSLTTVACNGGSNGSATVVPSGGIAPYTYSWSPSGGTSATATGLSAGLYTVTVTDNSGCQTTRTFTVTQPSAIASSTVITNIACNGASNGSINLTVSGGVPPYTYNWNDGVTTEDRTGLAAGTYTVTITDANGCTKTVNSTVTQPTAISGTTVVTNVACNGASNGAINLTPAGGTVPYTFNWGGGVTTEDRTGLAAGTYTVIITDANGCTATVNTTVTQPTAISGTTVVTNVACNGASNGAINLTPAGGTAPYTFNWGGGITTEDRTGLAAGTYTVTITDANGCTATVNATVTQPASAVSGTTVVTNVACNGASNGSINLTPAGGTAPYTFNWGGGITTKDRTGLAAGTYTVTITDANGCTATVNATVTQPASAVSGTTVVTNVACNGAANGSINLTPAGGTAPYTFNWGGGITTEDRTGLAAGTYTVVITDANGCTATVSRTITQPTALVAATSQTNIACNGGSTGIAGVTVSGGTAPYTYAWSPAGGTAATATGLSAGTYTVTVTDANGCTLSRTFTITQPASAVSGTTVVTNVACNGASNGAINLTPAGGTAPYTFNWGGGITTEDRTGLAAGTYTVTITDANGCTATVNATVTQPASAVSGTTVVTNVACNGASNGSINLTPAGGTAPYTFNWGGGVTTEDRTGLAAGTYTVVITDANGCTATVNATVTQPASAVSGTTVVTNVACNGASNGAINLTPAGGTAPYTFNWGGGITTEDRTGLAAGTYTVTITDANGCTATVNTTVTQPASAVSGTTVVTNVACNGASNGSINLTPAGGTAPYTFNWGGGVTTEDRTGLAAGTYTVVITDANGCTATVNATVTQPASAVSGTTVVTNVACNGASNGSINLTPAGGTAPYTFNWGGGITTEDRTGLAAGTYTVIITDANGCTATVNATVTQPASAVSGTTVVTNVACNGASNGSINLTPAGGTAPYTFNWGGGITTEDRTGLSAGTYTVTITDANGCTATVNATVTQPTALSAAVTQTNVLCNGGSTGTATVTVTGGTAPYTYAWSPAGGTAATASGLSAGTYTVTVTDANGCTLTRTVTITQSSAVSGTTVVTNVACNGASNGAINLTPAGGTAPYTFNWGGGVTTEDRTGLAAGTYTVTITDANGCTATVNATVTQPTALSAAVTQTNVLCNGGSTGTASVTVTGGTAPYTYAWSPSGGTAATASGLSAGTYTVTVTDANGCTLTRTVTITQSSAVSGTTVVTNVACNGASNGSINLTPAGGTAPYTFNWGGGITTEDRTGLAAGTYTVIITDANGCTATVNATVTQPASAVSGTTVVTNVACNGASNGAINLTPAGGTAPYTFNWGGGITTEDRTGLAAGTYTVTITDANGCTATVNATVTQPASAVSGTTVVTNVACNGASNGSINLTPAGGTAPYTFNWGGGVTTEDRTGLAAGTYTVVITDANGCTATVNATVTQPTALSATTSQTNVSCNGGSTGTATITVSGGTAPYTYAWSPSGGTAATASGLSAGTYTVTVTDANGCTATVNATVTQPASAVSGTTVVTNVACNGASNGAINLTPAGGTAPYTFNWGGGVTTEDRTGLAAGTYTVTITDANGCTATVNTTVTQPTALSAAVTQTNVLCNGGSTGTASVTVTGGTAPYTYAWSPAGGTAATASGLSAGTYTVTVTDANGCTLTRTVTITQSSAVSGTTVVTNVACNGASNGAINLTPAGGTAPYTFNWGGGITTEDRTGLAAGTYTVTITDANGCTATVNATVTQPASAVSGTTVVTNVACNGASNGAINLTPAGGTAPYTFNWGGGVTTEDRTGLAAGTYTVTITDANGCTATVNATVTQPASAVSGTTVVTNVACNGASNGAINLTPAGGTAPYTFNWGGGVTTEDRTGLAAGTYTVTITDANGCTATVNATVTQPTALSATTSQTNVSCNGGSTGTATITVSGGTAPYVYSWSPAGGTGATASGLSAGTYTVNLTDAKGCTLSRTFTITQSAPVAAPTGAASQNFAPGSTLSALVVTGQNIKWYASASDAQNHVNSLPLTTALVNNTTYYATQTAGSCESTAYLAVLAINSTLGVTDNTKPKSQLQIYPNPVRDILNFSGTEAITKAVIIAADGRLVTEKKLKSGERSIDVQALPQGMYLIQVFTENGMQTFKFIKK